MDEREGEAEKERASTEARLAAYFYLFSLQPHLACNLGDINFPLAVLITLQTNPSLCSIRRQR